MCSKESRSVLIVLIAPVAPTELITKEGLF